MLRQAGLEASDVRDHGLGGRDDSEIFSFVASHRWILVTRDVAAANIGRIPSGARFGIVLIRFPQAISVRDLNVAVAVALRGVAPSRLVGAVTVVEPGRIRVRRKIR